MELPAADRNVLYTGAGNPDTSHAAHLAFLPRSGSMRLAMLQAYAEHGPMTDEELELAMGISHQTASGGSRNSLVRDGWIRWTGEKRRIERTGNMARVWGLTFRARQRLGLERRRVVRRPTNWST